MIDLTAFDTTTAPSNLWDGLNTTGDSARMITPTQDSVVDYLLSLPQGEFEEKKGQEWWVNEKNAAGYVQAEYAGSKYRGNVGVRVVNTKDSAKYWEQTTLLLDDRGTEDTSDDLKETVFSRVKKDTSYTKVLPNLNFVYNFTDSLMLRAGAAKVIARPRYSDMAGYFSLDDQQLTGGGGNPDLKPYEAYNFNLALEYYMGKNGILSAEYFLRDISNYVLSVTEQKELYNQSRQTTSIYNVTSPFNAGDATVSGVAFSLQRDIALGFGISANYTFAESETTAGYNLPYLSKHTYNIIPYFEHGPWMARVSYSWRSEFFTSIGRLNLPLFADAYKQFDASLSYSINKKFQVTLNAANLLDDTYYWYYQTKYAPMGVYKNGRKFALSVTYKM